MLRFALPAAAAFLAAPLASAAFVIEIDTDGVDDGVLTYNPNFSFGGDTTTASQSGAPSQTPGVVAVGSGDSIFGGDGSVSDDYVYTYTPAVDGDNNQQQGFFNTSLAATSGLTAGSSGGYDVYAIWNSSTNINAAGSTFTLADATGAQVFSTTIDQNGLADWVLVGSGVLDANTTYTLTQSSEVNSFVSQRAHSVLFEATSIVPEPASAALLATGLGLLAARRRRG